MSLIPSLPLLVKFLIWAFMSLRPIAKSVSLYSSLTFVIAVYVLGTQSHTTMASRVAAMVAIMYGCFFKSNVKLEV